VNDDNKTIVAAIDPMASMQAVKNDKLGEVAETIQRKLKKVVERL
jgi:predicted ATP-grasp superfamily ATP-dependent carboligase